MKITLSILVYLFFFQSLFAQIFEDFEDNQLIPEVELKPDIEGVGGLVQITLGDGVNSNRGLRMGKFFDGSLTKNGLEITLDNSYIEPNTFLFFNIKDNDDENTSGDGILFSVDGQPFVPVYSFSPESWCNSWGAFPPFNIFTLAESNGIDLTNANSLVIRIQQHDDSDFLSGGDRDGFTLDNVAVFSAPPVYANLPFTDNFDNAINGQLGPSWRWSHPDETAALANTTKPTGTVFINGSGNEKWVDMGKVCDDGATANALDLHLNLANQSDVFLSFSIRDNSDENHPQDGIFFSQDGGQNFKQVYTFSPEDWCDSWGTFPPFSVDELAAAANLSLTDQFVIRFQQFDDADFISGGDRDGLSIDNVSVYSATPVYANLPFEDNFNSAVNGQFGPSWQWSHADQTVQLAGTTKPTGGVRIAESGNEKWATMGKVCDDGATANALDLHLNLLGESDVFLFFSTFDNAEETHPQDGIFL